MKDLLVGLVEFFFENISNKDDYTLKDLFMVILKIVLFLLILTVILYFLLNKTETITISD